MSQEDKEWTDRTARILKGRLAEVSKERDELRTRLDAWHSAFQTSRLSHAQARLEQAERDAQRLKEWSDRQAAKFDRLMRG